MGIGFWCIEFPFAVFLASPADRASFLRRSAGDAALIRLRDFQGYHSSILIQDSFFGRSTLMKVPFSPFFEMNTSDSPIQSSVSSLPTCATMFPISHLSKRVR